MHADLVRPGGRVFMEKIALEDATDLYTRGSAHSEFAEREKGRLEPGALLVFERGR